MLLGPKFEGRSRTEAGRPAPPQYGLPNMLKKGCLLERILSVKQRVVFGHSRTMTSNPQEKTVPLRVYKLSLARRCVEVVARKSYTEAEKKMGQRQNGKSGISPRDCDGAK